MKLTKEEKYKLIYRKFDDNKHEGNPRCPLCGEHYRISNKEQSLNQHIKKYHSNIYKEYVKLINNFNDKRLKEYVECPICGKKLKHLERHVLIKHNYITTEDFKKDFPECPLTIFKSTKHKSSKKEMLCEDNKTKYTCAICGYKTNSIKDHVVSKHRIEWENYCDTYNHDINDKIFFTKKHRENLSKNKKEFYRTKRGKELIKEYSLKYSGELNPSKRKEIRDKISTKQSKIFNSYKEQGFKLFSSGLRIKFPKIGLNKFCRSFVEFKIAYTCFINNLDYEYEPEIIKLELKNKKNYIPDFKIKNTYIEIKSNLKHYDFEKYIKIKKNLETKHINFEVHDYNSFCERFKLEPISEKEFIDIIKLNLDLNLLKISYVTIGERKSRLLVKIDKNYENNKNINFNGNHKEVLNEN